MTAGSVRSIAFVVFPRLTLLDLVGPYDVLRRVRTMNIDPAVSWRFLGTQAQVADDSGLPVHVDGVLEPLAKFDLLVVPGGYGADSLRADAGFLTWLSSWSPQKPVASVCSGALLLGEAGFLRGLPATTHHQRLEALAPLCDRVVSDRRVVDAGRVITSAGVTAGLDLGLHLVARFWGQAARNRIARQMEFVG